MRRAARVDANQEAIVEALRKIGCRVHTMQAMGGGFPDLLVSFRGMLSLIEVKDGSKPPSQRKLTPAQEKWHAEWGDDVRVVKSVQEAIEAVTR